MNNPKILVTRLLHATFILVLSLSAQSQTNSVPKDFDAFDDSYGLDPLLVNGRRYFRTNLHASGHPFYLSEDTYEGKVCIAGICYPDVKLKYELNRGEFILVFSDKNDVPNLILLNKELIDSVVIDRVKFTQNPFDEIENTFIQVIYTDSVSAYATYFKEYIFQNVGAQTGHKYGETIIKYYIKTGNNIQPVNSKYSFVRAFPKSNRKAIKAYLAQNKVKFKKASWIEFKEIIEFCNTELK